MSRLTKVFLAFTIISAILFFSYAGVDIYRSTQFNKNCAEYIELAARSTTVEMAKENLDKAITYAETKGVTTGDTNIFVDYPTNDINFWYQNLVETRSALETLDDSSAFEESNVLLKLETLTKQTKYGIAAIYPDNIYEYPNQVLFFWWGLISGIMFFFWAIALLFRIVIYF